MCRQWKHGGERPFVLLRDLVPRYHPPPPPLVCLPMICRREEQHMWPLSVDEHVQCHCQIVRSCPTPHCLGPATALETHKHTHARTEHRYFLEQDSRSARLPTIETFCIFLKTINRNWLIATAQCWMWVLQHSQAATCWGFFFCNITVNTVDWMLKGLAKHAWRRTKHSTAVQVSFLAKLCPVLPTCRLWC